MVGAPQSVDASAGRDDRTPAVPSAGLREWLFGLLDRIEAMPDDATGALMFGPRDIATAGCAVLTTREIFELGRCARELFFSELANRTSATTQAFVAPGGGTVVAYRELDRTVIMLCADATAAARVFARRLVKG